MEQIETPKPPVFVFEATLTNHAWNGVIVPKCLARCAKVDIFENTATTYTEYFSILADGNVVHLTTINDTFEVVLDQPLRAQVLAHFQSIFSVTQPQSNPDLWS